ncbi:MAG TPA: DUF418 domain-containing protein [Sphingomonadaceae bacterium]|nr:DUF418 domain-containing protein [Sphingomonadaceae bacterium]
MNNRIDMVDALRGYALLGLFLVHCIERFEVFWLAPQFDAWHEWVFALFAGKAFAIFALLFGFGFATIMANERARGGDFTLRFVWRLVLLLGFGTLHVIFYRGDILQVLALVGLLLVPLDRIRSDRVLLVLAALALAQLPLWWRLWAAGDGQAWALAQPLYFSWGSLPTLAEGSFGAVALDNLGPGTVGKWSFYIENGRVMEIVGLFLIGMLLQRRRLFADAGARRGFWLVVGLAGALGWLAAQGMTQWIEANPLDPRQAQTGAWLLEQARGLPAMAFQVAVFVLVWHSPARLLLAWLAAPGRMTLTLYIGQSIVFAPLLYGYGFGWWDDLTNAEMVAIGVLTFALQAVLAALWFRAFRYGPLEWLWRAGTRTTLAVPLRRTAA